MYVYQRLIHYTRGDITGDHFYLRNQKKGECHGFPMGSPRRLVAKRPMDLPGLVNCYITMERSTIFHGKIHYFYGHFQ